MNSKSPINDSDVYEVKNKSFEHAFRNSLDPRLGNYVYKLRTGAKE